MSNTETLEPKPLLLVFDWLSCTFPTLSDPQSVVSLLQLPNDIVWDTCNGRKGYKWKIVYDNIQIAYDNPNPYNPGCWLEMTGRGCRTFESFSRHKSILNFVHYIKDYQKHYSRIDLAVDCFNNELPLDKIQRDARRNNYTSKAQKVLVDENLRGADYSLYFGSKMSDYRIRIYNKAAEQGVDYSWVRCEQQLRNDYAGAAIDYILECNNPIEVYLGLLDDHIAFVQPGSDTNRSRRPHRQYWDKFIEGAAQIDHFSSKGKEFNLAKFTEYYNRLRSANYTYQKIFGISKVIEDNMNFPIEALNDKYETLIRQNEKWES